VIVKKETARSGTKCCLVVLAIAAIVTSFAVTDARAGLPLLPAPPLPKGLPAPPGVVVTGGGGVYGKSGGHRHKKPKHKGHAYGHGKHKKHH
jgi:hypothetical protein